MDLNQKLIDMEEIRMLKARYFRFMDLRQWDKWKTDIFLEDATMDIVDTPGVHESERATRGVDAIVEFVSSVLDGSVSIHHGHNPEIEILSPTTAKCIWALHDRLIWKAPNKYGWTSLEGAGHYHETYEKTPAGWRIKTLVLTRLWVEIQ